MIVIQDIVELELASKSKKSMRMKLTSSITHSLSLKSGDYAQIYILGIFKDPSKTNHIAVNIPMVGRVIKRGQTSLGLTIKPHIVKRLDLQEHYELLISIEKLVKGPT